MMRGMAVEESAGSARPTLVYTDGACSGNPGPGGWAWAVPSGPWASGAAAETTNQRMELTAVVEAVRALDGPLEIRSDSTYVVNCFRQGWWKGWLARGWRNAQRKPVANRDLWEPLVEAYRQRGDLDFVWVKGHGGDRFNDLVDRLAVEAARTQIGRQGRAESEDAGWRVVAHGPPPADLPAGDDTVLRARIADVLTEVAGRHADLVVMTGLRRGGEQLVAEVAAGLDLPYRAVLPFPEAAAGWPEPDRRRLAGLLAGAAEVVVLAPSPPPDPSGALAGRDRWLADHADEALVLWDGSPGRLHKVWRELAAGLDERVWVLDPSTATS